MTRSQMDALAALRAAGGVRTEVPRSVSQAHALQRFEPPKPYTLALAARRAAEGSPAAAARRATGVPAPWSIALQQRKAEGR